LVFIIIPIFGTVVVWKYFPETARMSLEEIGEKFGEPVAIHLNAAEGEKALVIQSENLNEEKQTVPWTTAEELTETA
jgi:hypothetical protein